MKGKLLKTILAAAMLAALFLCACAPRAKKPEETEAPRVTEVPQADYTVSHYIRYWPEDADYDTCDYACVLQAPHFTQEHTSGYAMNKAVDAYIDELAARIENEYMPASSEHPPYSEVTFECRRTGGVTNIIFIEKHCYQTEPYTSTYTLMLDERGGELSLNDWFSYYRADRRIAEALEKRIAGDDRYFSCDGEKLFSLIDVRHGAYATDTGCRVFIPGGELAPLEEGELSFDFTFEEILPDIAGENGVMTVEEYRSAVRLMSLIANAMAVRGGSVENGETTPFIATAFMGQAVLELKLLPNAGLIDVPGDDFEALYRACFMSEFPGIDTDAHKMTVDEEGVYHVAAKQPDYVYNVDAAEISREGDTVTISGDMVFGAFGYAFSEYVSHVRVVLVKSSESPFSWAVKDFIQSL